MDVIICSSLIVRVSEKILRKGLAFIDVRPK